MSLPARPTEIPRNVLIVEDEKEIRRFVRHALEGEGFRVYEAESLQRGLVEAGTRKPDLAILDLGLPDGNGVDFIHAVRAWTGMPIIVLSARIEEHDKVEALDAGADDYLAKPFGVAELLARVRSALRRIAQAGAAQNTTVSFGDVIVDLADRKVTRADQVVRLTQIEFRLLAALLSHPGKVLTHRHLLREVWGPAYVEHNHYLRIYMGHLRRKLESDPARPLHLITEIGIGYRYMPA
ncbi:MAG: two-component system response regulator KdpE [Gammaproteobacteria bacterium]|jgi:two-component system KDP operon response regulator KdpE|nr:MAG: two-component system response regulator KdpE [Gammaproteobacteria bacterium]